MTTPALTRAFSFQSHDDDPEYHALPSTNSPYSHPPPRRRDSSDSSSSDDEDVRFAHTITRKPVPLSTGMASSADIPPSPSTDSGSTPIGGYRTDDRFWGQAIGYSHSYSPAPVPQPIPEYNVSAAATAVAGVYESSQGLVEASAPPQHREVDMAEGHRVLVDPSGGHYTDNPYKRFSTTWDPVLSGSQVQLGGAGDILSDDEDSGHRTGLRGGAVSAGAAGTVMAALGGRVGKPVSMDAQRVVPEGEKSEWLQQQTKGKRRTRWIVGLLVLVIILGAAGGTAAGVIISRRNSSSAASSGEANGGGGSGLTADEDVRVNGDLNADSPEIRSLMGNPNLKRVFHGIDYTPLNAALYPECLSNPPTQNNITRDIAVMSQLTPRLRLYGTDCNQTEMVLHAIDALGVDMKIWLGVWLDSNVTTNTRQLSHLYTLLSTYDHNLFEGVAIGNEVLFREDLTQAQLVSTIDAVRSNLSALNIDLPVGTSDLGSNWRSDMVQAVDVLMANVHPFFAGVDVRDAANWTWNFFQTNDVYLTRGMNPSPRVMISEVGWPSEGGRRNGSVAGIEELNYFLEEFVCTENARDTEYFWFSAFDEPWKVRFNQPAIGEEWEDKWGLMDVNRNLKDGVVIPDCVLPTTTRKKSKTKRTLWERSWSWMW